MRIKAAVCRAKHSPFIFEDLDLDAPRDNEILVKIKACGLCHTDIAMRDQAYPVPQPIVLGHEGVGEVVETGKNVSTFSPGDPVLLTINSCGRCPACMEGFIGFCHHFWDYNFAGTRPDGSTALRKGAEQIHSNFFGQSSFATYALAYERNLIKLDSAQDMDYFAPLGCGVQTGAGGVLNALKVGVGESFVVFGIGSVALSGIMAARVGGATTIIAVGRHDKKLELARELGATHTINSSRCSELVKEIKDISGGGANASLDTTGIPSIIRQAVDCLGIMGRCAILGASPVGTTVELDIPDLMNKGKVFMGTVEGNCVPQLFIPTLIALYRQGRFPLDKMISFYPFDQINKAVEDSEQGKIIKAVLRME